jgi:hypothetical protein
MRHPIRRISFAVSTLVILLPALACGGGDDEEEDEGSATTTIGSSFRIPTSGGGESDFSFIINSVESFGQIGDQVPPAGQKFIAVTYTGKNESGQPRSPLLPARVILRHGTERIIATNIEGGMALSMAEPLPTTGRLGLTDVPPNETQPFRDVFAVPEAMATGEIEVVFTEPITLFGTPDEVVLTITPTPRENPGPAAPAADPSLPAEPAPVP